MNVRALVVLLMLVPPSICSPVARASDIAKLNDAIDKEGQASAFAVLKQVKSFPSETSYKVSPLHLASYYGYVDLVQALSDPAYPFLKNDPGTKNDPLIAASGSDQPTGAVVTLLLKKGVDPNTYNGTTPLHAAAARANLDIVRELLVAGADPSVKDASGKLAADIAIDRLSVGRDGINMDRKLEVLRALLPQPAHRSFPQTPDFVDLTLNDILVGDPLSLLAVLGVDPAAHGTAAAAKVEAHACVRNAAGTQNLILWRHPGAHANQYAEWEVRSYTDLKACEAAPKLSHIQSFVSGKGVRLGMKPKDVRDRLGTGVVTHSSGEGFRLAYKLAGPNDWLLRVYNMPAYESWYFFDKDDEEGRLSAFRVGFPVP